MAEVQANPKDKKVLGRVLIIIVVLGLIFGGYLCLAASVEIRIDRRRRSGRFRYTPSVPASTGHVMDVKVEDAAAGVNNRRTCWSFSIPRTMKSPWRKRAPIWPTPSLRMRAIAATCQ